MMAGFLKPKRINDEATVHIEPTIKKLKPLTATQENRDVSKLSFKGLDLEHTTMAKDWQNAFGDVLKSKWFADLKIKLQQELDKSQIIYPPIDEIYSFTSCPLSDIKVVIIGQDPYHGDNQAHGHCFSVMKNVKIPPSLKNIYKEMASDIRGFSVPSHGYLHAWHVQGVLLLNATLTVTKAQPNSHAKFGWAKFTDAIIRYLNKNHENIVFMLWGGFAQKKGACIDGKRHLVLKATHPSPLGANKGGWFGSKPFSQANDYLAKHNKAEIDWALPLE